MQRGSYILRNFNSNKTIKVEGLRKQNYNLTELIKRMQAKENPEENEEEPASYQ